MAGVKSFSAGGSSIEGLSFKTLMDIVVPPREIGSSDWDDFGTGRGEEERTFWRPCSRRGQTSRYACHFTNLKEKGLG